MGSSKLNLFTIVAGLAFSTAVPLTSPVPGHQLLSRQASAALCGVFSDDGTPVATTIDETKCPQLHYTNLGYCYDSGEGPNVEAAIKAAGDLALAALRAMYNPKDVNNPPVAPISSSTIDPARHYYYFFDDDTNVAAFVTDIFRRVHACTIGESCNSVEIQCPGPYSSFVRQYSRCGDDTTVYGYLDGSKPSLCGPGLHLPPAPPPCSTAGGADSPGYALLMEMVKSSELVQQDKTYLEERTGFDSITDVNGEDAWKETLAEIGWGASGNGLKGKGLANAKNYASFAQWSWDLGFGGEDPWDGNTCEDHFTATVESQQLRPVGRNLRVLDSPGVE